MTVTNNNNYYTLQSPSVFSLAKSLQLILGNSATYRLFTNLYLQISDKLCRLTIKQRGLNEAITFEKVFWYPTQVFQCSVQGQCEVSFFISLLSLINNSNYGFMMQPELKAKLQFMHFKFTSHNGLPHYLHVLLTYCKTEKHKLEPVIN